MPCASNDISRCASQTLDLQQNFANNSILTSPSSSITGYSRLATAYAGLERDTEAIEAITIGANNTKHASLLQKVKELKSQPVSELLRTKPNADPIMIQSPAIGGTIRQMSKRLKACASLFQGTMQLLFRAI